MGMNMELLIRDDIILIVSEAVAAGKIVPENVADRILGLKEVQDAFAAWWREETYSSIYDGGED